MQNFVSAAVGIAVAVALIRGLDAPPLGDDRQLLGRPHPRRRRASSCRSRVVVALLLVEPGRRPELRAAPPTATTRRGRDAGRSPAGRSRARRRSRSSARTAAASSTPTPRIRSRTPPAFTNFARDLAAAADPVRAHATRSAGWSGISGRAGRCFAAMFVLWIGSAGARRCASSSTATRRSSAGRRDADAAGGNMEGKEVRFGAAASALFAGVDDRHLDRRGQLRCTTASRRSAARSRSCNIMLGEVTPGRRRRRAVRHADLRAARGVHRRADGRANAGVPRQEDPGARR